MSFFGRIFKSLRKPPPPSDGLPFMEHPSGKFRTSLDAITDAMNRLDKLGKTDRWIKFSGQGEGSRPDSIHAVDIPYRNGAFRIDSGPVDVRAVAEFAGVDASKVESSGQSEVTIDLSRATPAERARFLDGLFRKHSGLRHHEGENDYSVGAEW